MKVTHSPAHMTEIHINKIKLTLLTMIETIRVSSKGQIVIPEHVRKRLRIKKGSRLVLVERGNKIVLESEQAFILELEGMRAEQEKLGWLKLTFDDMGKVWANPKDEKEWAKYL